MKRRNFLKSAIVGVIGAALAPLNKFIPGPRIVHKIIVEGEPDTFGRAKALETAMRKTQDFVYFDVLHDFDNVMMDLVGHAKKKLRKEEDQCNSENIKNK